MNCLCIGNPKRTAMPENAYILLRYVTMSLALCPEKVSFHTSRRNFFEQAAHQLFKELAMEFLPFDYCGIYDSADKTAFSQSEIIICYATKEETDFYPRLQQWEKEGKVVINLAEEPKPVLHKLIANRYITLPLNGAMKSDFQIEKR